MRRSFRAELTPEGEPAPQDWCCTCVTWRPAADFNNASSKHLSCKDCRRNRKEAERALDPRRHLLIAMAAGVRGRASRQAGCVVRPDLEAFLEASLYDGSYCPLSGMVYTQETRSFYQPSMDQYPAGAGYGADARIILKLFNISESAGGARTTLEPYHLMECYEATIASALSELRRRIITDPDDFLLCFSEITDVLADEDSVATLNDAADVFDAESHTLRASWQRWLDPDSPKHKPKLYAKLFKSITDRVESDKTCANKENLDKPDRVYVPEDFIPKIVAQDGRCPVTALPLTMAGGYAFPSLNRLKRKPGHVPPNTEFVAHMANGYGNARSVEDDVLTRKRMVEMCLHTKFLELSLTKLERLALRVLYDA